jgi:hypothetical protein
MAIILMAIGGYSISGYSINVYWLLFYWWWRAPKFLVRAKMGLSYSNNEVVRNLGHTPSS